tara:strand:- start:1104 stop:1568 length:465 start_codon:yes stop_codon:yes gene_type:complete
MFKKFFLIIILVLSGACGYEAVNTEKKLLSSNFSINQVIFLGDKEINRNLKQKINKYTRSKEIKNYDLQIESQSIKSILGKDTKGNATIFNLELDITIIIKRTNFENIELQINESFKYNNNSNKFELQSYERDLKNNLLGIVMQKLVNKLSNNQ